MTGQYVKAKIEGLGLSLAEVARRLHISPQTLNKRLNVDDIKVGVLREIATAINQSVYFFLEEGSTVTVQNQANGKSATKNVQQGAFNGAQLNLEGQLNDCLNRLNEKDQVISDLRRTINLYEKLLNTSSTARL